MMLLKFASPQYMDPRGWREGNRPYEMRAGSLFMLYIILANYYMENCAIYLNTWKC
uniref:Uncharacterized protein n=1 Tax=Anguilla anguilla TaxID=7936 RepID=A0A0E9WG20_ANGAN